MNKLTTGLFLAAVVAAITGALTGPVMLYWVGKPLATTLLLVAVLRCGAGRYGHLIAAGLGFSLAGDIFLMLPQDLFLAGLISFFAAHLCYIRAFGLGVGLTREWPILLTFLMVALAIVVLLWPGLPAGMGLLVSAYGIVLAVMAAQAVGRAQLTRHRADQMAAIGAIAFLGSDTALAFNRFVGPLPLSPLLVLGSYWLAQYLIARSALSPAAQR